MRRARAPQLQQCRLHRDRFSRRPVPRLSSGALMACVHPRHKSRFRAALQSSMLVLEATLLRSKESSRMECNSAITRSHFGKSSTFGSPDILGQGRILTHDRSITTNIADEDQITGAANLLSLSQRSHRYPVAAYRIAQSSESATAQSTEHRQAEAPVQSHYFGFTTPVSVTAPAIANPERVPGSSDGNPWFYRRLPNHAQYAEYSHQTAHYQEYPSRILPPPAGYVLSRAPPHYYLHSAPQHAQRIHEHQADFNTYYVDESQRAAL